jgi:hypothetical protein
MERLKTILLVSGWVLAAILTWVGRQTPVSTPTVETKKQEVTETQKEVRKDTKVQTKKTVKKPDGTTIVIEKSRDTVETEVETGKSVKTEHTKVSPAPAKPQHSISIGFKPDLTTLSLRPHEFTYGRRVTGDLWLTLGATANRELILGLRLDF